MHLKSICPMSICNKLGKTITVGLSVHFTNLVTLLMNTRYSGVPSRVGHASTNL